MATRKVERRVPDQHIQQIVEQQAHLHDCVESVKAEVMLLKADLRKNTEVTEQVRDILGTFRFTMAAGKWMAAVGAGAVGLWHLIKFGRQ